LSRAGKRVLQIDSNQSYGGDDASFPIDQFTARFASSDSPPTSHSENNNNINNNNINNSENNNNTNIVTGEIPLSSNASAVHNVSIVVAKQMIDDVESPLLSATQLRRCVVDLWPRLLFARSPMIDTLVRSGVNRYLEFKCLQACFMHVPEGGLALVPASKTQVFRDQTLSLLQKRSLMKLFSAIVAAPASDETPPTEEAPAPLPQTGSFDDVLVGAKLGTIASSFAKHAIALDPSPRTDDESSRERDIANCRRYAQSIGVYGATPFLASLYGTGELAQAYCRLGAVFGGIFVMQCGDVSLVPADDQTTLRAVRCKEGVIAAKQFVILSSGADRHFASAVCPTHRLHLCACLLSGSSVADRR
jgi:RAB protein geranylgeranyltransferase component A